MNSGDNHASLFMLKGLISSRKLCIIWEKLICELYIFADSYGLSAS